MSDRRTLFTTAALLLRRMEELNDQIAEGRSMSDARTQAQGLRRQWGKLMQQLTQPAHREQESRSCTQRAEIARQAAAVRWRLKE